MNVGDRHRVCMGIVMQPAGHAIPFRPSRVGGYGLMHVPGWPVAAEHHGNCSGGRSGEGGQTTDEEIRMRRSIVVVLVAVSLVLAGSTAVLFAKYRQSESDYAQVKMEEESTRLHYGEAITEIATIQDSLNTIVLGEEAARLIPTQLQAELQLSPSRGDEAMERIALLKAGVARTKARIEELDSNLRRSGVKIAGLEKMIAGLRRKVAQKEQMVAQLTTQVDTLETRVSGLAFLVQEKQRELGTIYYAMGTKKDLMTSGVVVAKGGILGIGKTLEPSGHVDESAFTPLDTDQEDIIRIPASRVEVLSAQPVSSYAIEPVEDNLVELRILHPEEFRKIKHLVILTT